MLSMEDLEMVKEEHKAKELEDLRRENRLYLDYLKSQIGEDKVNGIEATPKFAMDILTKRVMEVECILRNGLDYSSYELSKAKKEFDSLSLAICALDMLDRQAKAYAKSSNLGMPVINWLGDENNVP